MYNFVSFIDCSYFESNESLINAAKVNIGETDIIDVLTYDRTWQKYVLIPEHFRMAFNY